MKIDVTGLSIDDIMGMDWAVINRLSEKDLRALSGRLNSAANKRLKRLESSGLKDFSPAYTHVKEKGKFSTKGKDVIALKNEIQRATGFLGAKTGSIQGAKKHRETLGKLFGEEKKEKKKKSATGTPTASGGKKTTEAPSFDPQIDTMTKSQKKKLYGALDKLRESNAADVHNIGSDVIIRELRRAQLKDKRMSADNLLKQLYEKYPDLMEESEEKYEREQQEYQSRTDEDGVFRPLNDDESKDNPFKA